jgi:cell division protease FtsH
VFREKTSGARSDLMVANNLVERMVEQYGMGKNFGLRYCNQDVYGAPELTNGKSKIVEDDITEILNSCYRDAKDILVKNRELLDKIANELLIKETLEADDIKKLIA